MASQEPGDTDHKSLTFESEYLTDEESTVELLETNRFESVKLSLPGSHGTCSTEHIKARTLTSGESASPVSIAQVVLKCSSHPKEEARYFCQDCHKAICR